ncbi:MAG: SurA N-terminal domain-containing protein [Sulfuricaulis sp.]|uniref:SurA N-terminal domain-containing protein n=1 Tax=Sulfuricaulis sp. TaxID=2003553 RepID=UPI0025DDD13E|nr:SurA N-terminal domain-containing protein [Sulfuricaulis sp.]MCR4346656.1 SurA N-terminal domain-containing protein [Sulfuricaulis sp.]
MKRLLLLFALLLPGVAAAETTPATLPEIVARINDVAVTRAQFETRLAQSRSMNPSLFDAMGAEEKAHAMVRVLNGMIQRELEVREAHRRGITVAEEEIAQRLREMEASYANKGGLKQAFAEFKITPEQWKEETRRNLLIERLEAIESAAMPVTDEEVREEFLRNFWKEKTPPSSRELAEHREHMRMVIRQRRWPEQRKSWMQSLADVARLWRWTPAAGGAP